MRRRALTALLALIALCSAPGLTQTASAQTGTCPQYNALLAAVGLPRTFTALIWRESRCNPHATHHNRNGTTDRGLLQINSVHLRRGGAAAGLPSSALYNPYVNLTVAARLYHHAGWSPWQ